jgi:hypothetical protein
MLPDNAHGPILFFGGKAYLPLCSRLTASVQAEKIVFTKSESGLKLPGCVFTQFETPRRTNWHYECVDAYVTGRIQTRELS